MAESYWRSISRRFWPFIAMAALFLSFLLVGFLVGWGPLVLIVILGGIIVVLVTKFILVFVAPDPGVQRRKDEREQHLKMVRERARTMSASLKEEIETRRASSVRGGKPRYYRGEGTMPGTWGEDWSEGQDYSINYEGLKMTSSVKKREDGAEGD